VSPGRGSYGTVYLAEDENRTRIVLKEVTIQPDASAGSAASDAAAYAAATRAAVREARLLQAMKHPNIIKVYGAFEAGERVVAIVMEYAAGRDLAVRIAHRAALPRNEAERAAGPAAVAAAAAAAARKPGGGGGSGGGVKPGVSPLGGGKCNEAFMRRRHFSEKRVLHWALSSGFALGYLHDRKVLHRDIKTANILLTAENEVKLADFGVARKMDNTLDNANTQCGTPFYLSPELAKAQPYDYKSDIWSLGVVLYELCALERPFQVRLAVRL